MDQQIVQFVPVLSILLFMLTVVILIVSRLPSKEFAGMLDDRGFVVISLFAIFFLTLVLHLYQNQSWTADILTIVFGVAVGVVATYKPKRSGFEIEGSAIGDKVRRMEIEIHETRDSIMKQTQDIGQINQVVKRIDSLPQLATETDYLFLIAGDVSEIDQEIQRVIDDWTARGWRFNYIFRGSDPYWIYAFLREAKEPRVFKLYGYRDLWRPSPQKCRLANVGRVGDILLVDWLQRFF